MLFTPPAWRSYRDRLDETQMNRVIRNCERLATEHSNVDYVNLLGSELFSRVDFRDADHLNGAGARKLTRWLDNRLADTRR